VSKRRQREADESTADALTEFWSSTCWFSITEGDRLWSYARSLGHETADHAASSDVWREHLAFNVFWWERAVARRLSSSPTPESTIRRVVESVIVRTAVGPLRDLGPGELVALKDLGLVVTAEARRHQHETRYNDLVRLVAERCAQYAMAMLDEDECLEGDEDHGFVTEPNPECIPSPFREFAGNVYTALRIDEPIDPLPVAVTWAGDTLRQITTAREGDLDRWVGWNTIGDWIERQSSEFS